MSGFVPKFSRRWLGLLQVFVLALSCEARAQTAAAPQKGDAPGLTIEAVVGMGSWVDQTGPTAISFLLTNQSDKPMEGVLKIKDPYSGHEATLGEVYLSPSASRRFSAIQDISDWNDCVASFTNRGRTLWLRDLNLGSQGMYTAETKMAAFVTSVGTNLQLPGIVSDNSLKVAHSQMAIPVKTWQVPDHAAPMFPMHAIVLGAAIKETDLTAAQWKAIADWTCQGGTLFVERESEKVLERISSSCPLRCGPPVAEESMIVRATGLGSVITYANKQLISTQGKNTRAAIGERIAGLQTSHVTSLSNTSTNYWGGRTDRESAADKNRLLVVSFFGIYTLFSGIFAMMLFRQSRRRVGIYTLAVVGIASVSAAFLGGILRFSDGDVRTVTLTQLGAGGGVQIGKLEVQSGGGRNTQVGVTGNQIDLQFVGRGQQDNYYSYDSSQDANAIAPFTWQSNLAKDVANTYQVNVPMTPWGRRQLHATAYIPDLPKLDFKIGFVPDEPQPVTEPDEEELGTDEDFERTYYGNDMKYSGRPNGLLSIELINNLPFDISEAWVLVGAPATMRAGNLPYDYEGFVPNQPNELVVLDTYYSARINSIAAGQPYKKQIQVDFQWVDGWNRVRGWEGGSMVYPRLPNISTPSAWVVGKINKSPSLAIDEERSDFKPIKETHFFIQQIRPEDIPSAQFLKPAQDAIAREKAIEAKAQAKNGGSTSSKQPAGMP